MTTHVAADQQGPTPVIDHDRPRRIRKAVHYIPWFAYLLVLYVLVKLSGVDIRMVLFDLYGYALTWVEILQLAAALVAMIEIAKVSHPGENNLVEALLMGAVWVLYLVCFVLGAAQVKGFSIFSSMEFLMMLLVSGIQVVMGFVINTRTYGRNITDLR
jgi:hypothetical protein